MGRPAIHRCGKCHRPHQSQKSELCSYCAGRKPCPQCGKALERMVQWTRRCTHCNGRLARRAPPKSGYRGSDYQREAVYDSERRAFHGCLALNRTLTRPEAEQLTQAIAPHTKVEWSTRARRSYAWSSGLIRYAVRSHGGTSLWTVLHECAHALTADAHGPQFCAAYLRLVAQYAGLEHAVALAREFTAGKVHFSDWRSSN
jgi:hypothetical protein